MLYKPKLLVHRDIADLLETNKTKLNYIIIKFQIYALYYRVVNCGESRL